MRVVVTNQNQNDEENLQEWNQTNSHLNSQKRSLNGSYLRQKEENVENQNENKKYKEQSVQVENVITEDNDGIKFVYEDSIVSKN